MSEDGLFRFSLRVTREEDPELFAVLSSLSTNHLRRRNQLLQMMRVGAGLKSETVVVLERSAAKVSEQVSAPIETKSLVVAGDSAPVQPAVPSIQLEADDLAALVGLASGRGAQVGT